MPYHCECQQCINNEFNPEDYIIKKENFKILDKERPLGISGHLRVKDEAMSVAECIDSCIDALDELIITYNKSSDNTEEILKEYEKKYPDKIRLYFYAPDIIMYNKNEYNIKYSKIHYLDNYYNFGYIKIKYKYYMKIDADQIYFRDKLLKVREYIFCDLKKEKISKELRDFIRINKIAWYIPFKNLRNNFRTYFLKKKFNKDLDYIYNGCESILSLKDIILFSRIIYKDNCQFILGGFNLSLKNNSLYFTAEDIFNGCVGDTAIWIPNSSTSYIIPENYSCEGIFINVPRCSIGFLWVHLGNIKRNIYSSTNSNVVVNDIINSEWNSIKEYLNNGPQYRYGIYEDFGNNFFDEDKKYVTEEFCNKYLKKIPEYAIKNIANNITK